MNLEYKPFFHADLRGSHLPQSGLGQIAPYDERFGKRRRSRETRRSISMRVDFCLMKKFVAFPFLQFFLTALHAKL